MLVVAVAVAFVYWPGLHGDWGRDDYFQLAFVRLLDSPWALFAGDHFPVPGSVFRPLGVASMWLGAKLFGVGYAAHAASDLVLHAGVGLALLALLLRLGLAIGPATLATLLFAVHPVATGTALWWSARFDLLATLFVLLALNAACAYRARQRLLVLACVALAVLAALLSKEIGLTAVAAIGLLWVHWAWTEPVRRAQALRAIAVLCACTVAWFGWRALVLGTPASGLTGETSLAQAFAHGMLDWLRMAPGYFLQRARPGSTALAIAAVAVLIVAAALERARGASRQRDAVLAWPCIGACLLLVPAVLQAPVAALNAAPLQAGASAVESAMQSRLYYLGLAGLAVLCGGALGWIGRARSATVRVLAIAAWLPVLAALALASHRMADAFARRSAEIATIAHAAVDGVAAMALPPTRCHVVLMGAVQPPEWGGYVSMDSVLKATSRDLERVSHCWFHAEDMTWFHLLAAPVATRDAAPFEPLRLAGVELPWRDVGGVVIAYLQARQPFDATQLAGLRFLQWRDGRFVETPPPSPADGAGLHLGVAPAQ